MDAAPGSPAPGTAHPFTARDFDAARRFVDTDFGRIAYVEHGRGPVALFVHGALLNGYQWRHQLTGLSDIRRVIALDTLGMGHTQLRPGQPLGLKHQAAMFKAFLDALGIAEVDLVGNDSGGGAAQIFAARNPGCVRTMALLDCEVHDYDENVPAARAFRDSIASGALVRALQAAAVNPEVGRKILGAAYQHPARQPADALRSYAAPLVASPERTEQMLGYLAATTNRDLVEIAGELARVTAPTLVMWGTDDGFFPVKWAYWLRDHLPHVTEVVELDGARVFWPEERPELLNAKLRELWSGQR